MQIVAFLIALLVSLTLMEMMFAMGLRLTFTELAGSIISSPWLVLRAVIANYLIIPGLTLLVLLIFHTPPLIAIGFLLLAVCPAAPYGPPFTAIARGNLSLSVSLMVILAGFSAILAPLLLYFLLPIVAPGNFSLKFDTLRLVSTLFMIQLLPLCLGLAIRQWKPLLAGKLAVPSSHLSKLLNALMVIAIAVVQVRSLAEIGLSGFITMAALLCTCLITGWLMGWPGNENRKTLTITTSLRNMSLSIVIASSSFPGSPAVTTVLAYAFVSGTGLLFLVMWWRFRGSVAGVNTH